ncbi:MAG TPA: hypothetical protein VGJ21_04310 [Terracidiphilus sp.]|jgi:hypothetical protein
MNLVACLRKICTLALMLASTACLVRLSNAQALSTGAIADPTLGGIKAFTVNIPAGWQFQGTVVRGPDCYPNSSATFRAYSRDGLTEIRLLPTFNWSFHPAIRMNTIAGCLPYKSTMSAAEFLSHFVELIPGGVHVDGPMSIAQPYRERVEEVASSLNANNRTPGFHATVDTAALRVETINGSFVIEQRVRVWIGCRTNNQAGVFSGGGCDAHVDVLRAPKGKLDALVALVDAHDLTKPTGDPQWKAAYLQRQSRENAQRMRDLTETENRQLSMIQAQGEQIQETMKRNHEAFMAQQESQFQSAMKNANSAMNARTTAASDWVDYALDQQTVYGSGGLAKVSSAYSQTWSNGQNQWFQTNDPNADPNGTLYGNWTRNVKVHGNGQPQ